MKVHRFLVSMLAVAALLLACPPKTPETGTSATNAPTPTVDRESTAPALGADIPKEQEKYLLKPKPGHKWVAPGIVTTKKLFDCPGAPVKAGPVGAEPQAASADTGAFVCSNVWRVELLVKKGDPKVYVTPEDKLEIEVGDCILWEAKTEAGDPDRAGIGLVKFYDSAADIPAGKTAPAAQVNQNAVGRGFCKTRQVLCVMRFDLAVGTYGYKVVVNHENQDKITDPETEVSCTGCDTPGVAGAPGGQP